MQIRIEQVSVSERPVKMRLPFQFGNTEVRETAEAYAEIRIVAADRAVRGAAAQLMVPRWFDKRQALSNAETIDELRHSVRAAARLAEGQSGSVAALSRELRETVVRAMPGGTPALAAGFGPALIEMALIDAACLAANLSFAEAARADLFRLASLAPPDLPADALTRHLAFVREPGRLALRHTIGFDAPLHMSEVLDRPDDGLPVSVEEVIAAYGFRRFKIKLKGKPEADLVRLRAIAGLIGTLPDYAVTLDANEQYEQETFGELLAGLRADGGLAHFCDAILFFEQPFAREQALDAGSRVDFGVPLVIDESDDADDALVHALDLGWAGTSVKSCKGVLRALLNFARARERGEVILTGEDLTCQPGLCWQQDTVMASAVGVVDAERNGHHFAGGMQGAPEGEIDQALSSLPDLYRRRDGRPVLRIERGMVDVGGLARPGFGLSAHVNMSQNERLGGDA